MPAAPQPKPAPTSAPAPDHELQAIAQAVTGGKVSVALRYRYEQVNERRGSNGADTEAHASTARIAIGYQTKAYAGFSAFAQYEGVFQIGQQIHNERPAGFTSDYARFPQVIDPEGSELNQAYVRWVLPGTVSTGTPPNLVQVTVGRQDVVLGNARLVGNVAWRQNNQTFDAASVQATPFADDADADPLLKGARLGVTYLSRVHRITGPARSAGTPGANDGTLDLDGWVAELATKQSDLLSASLYGVQIAYPDVPGQSCRTVGLRLEGPYKIDADLSVLYALEYARQTNFAGNPNDYTADYAQAELGLAWKGIGLRGGFTRLEGSTATDKFLTPLSTGHAFNGWAEKFIATPDKGLEAWSVTLAGSLPMILDGLRAHLVAYRFSSQTDHIHYGDEIDANIEWTAIPVDKRLVFGFKIGAFRDDEEENAGLYKDTVKTSVYTAWSF